MGEIREKFFSDADFLSKAIESSRSTGGLLAMAPQSIKEDRKLVLAEAKKVLYYSNLPDSFKSDEEIVMEMVNRFKFDDLTESLRHSKDFVVKVLKKRPTIYGELPEHLQVDQEIAMAVLKSSERLYTPEIVEKIFKGIPELWYSREALEALARNKPYSSARRSTLVPCSPTEIFSGLQSLDLQTCCVPYLTICAGIQTCCQQH